MPPTAFSFAYFLAKSYGAIAGKMSRTLVKGGRSGSLAAVCLGFRVSAGIGFWGSSWTEMWALLGSAVVKAPHFITLRASVLFS